MNNNVEKVDITSGDNSEHLARALKSIRDGYVIVVPLEHGYVYACDAFSHFARLRRDFHAVCVQMFKS